ncbi:MAG: DUF721 domain-containing protein [bacterium]|nr:DUF721 domain-containing protein [bacterium]
MMRSLGDLLKDVVQKYRLQDELHKSRMPRYWAEVVGERVAQQTEVRSFENGILRIHVQQAPWRSELMLRREELRSQLNARIGSEMIREIVLR